MYFVQEVESSPAIIVCTVLAEEGQMATRGLFTGFPFKLQVCDKWNPAFGWHYTAVGNSNAQTCICKIFP